MHAKNRLPRLLLISLVSLGACENEGGLTGENTAAAAPARERLMYIALGGESRLAVVRLGIDGTLVGEPALGVTLPGRPGAMAYARSTRRLYVGVGGDGGRIATISLDARGQPVLVGLSSGTGFPVFADVGHSGQTLVTAYFGDDRLRSHDISQPPPHPQLDALATVDEPHQALVGPTGDLVYVPHRNGQRISWYTLGGDGSLTPRGRLESQTGAGPRHLAFTPDGQYAYVINEYDDSVSAHRVGSDGALSRSQTISTLPHGIDGGMNTGADIHVSPDGRFVYASNRGHDSIAMFAIKRGGKLRTLGHVGTEARPREFALSPDGRFLVVAGRDSGFLRSYSVQSDGTLSSVDRLKVGKNLRWLIID